MLCQHLFNQFWNRSMNDTNLIYCHKLKKKSIALKQAPIPGQLGEKIQQQISQTAWQSWLERQIMLINENRLDLSSPDAQKYLLNAMEAYLFQDEDILPKHYKPELD